MTTATTVGLDDDESWLAAERDSSSSNPAAAAVAASFFQDLDPSPLISPPPGWVSSTKHNAAHLEQLEALASTINSNDHQQQTDFSSLLQPLEEPEQQELSSLMVLKQDCPSEDQAEQQLEQPEQQQQHQQLQHASSSSSPPRVFSHGQWSQTECKVLLEAKQREKELCTGVRKHALPYTERWKAVAEFCWSRGVHRSKDQCRFKWENAMAEFKKVKAHQGDLKNTGAKSYFDMDKSERKSCQLPRNMEAQFYAVMESVLDVKPTKEEHSNGNVQDEQDTTTKSKKRRRLMGGSSTTTCEDKFSLLVTEERGSGMELVRLKQDDHQHQVHDQARHQEKVALERDKVVALSSIAAALNNLAVAVHKMADSFSSPQAS